MRTWSYEFAEYRQMFSIGVSDPDGFFPRKEIAYASRREDAEMIVTALNAAEREVEEPLTEAQKLALQAAGHSQLNSDWGVGL